MNVSLPLSGHTAVVLLDPYNDFLSEGGKLWPAVAAVTQRTGAVENMLRIVRAARERGHAVVFAPHRRHRDGDLAGWRHPNGSQLAWDANRLFAADSWGGTFREGFEPEAEEPVASEHWAQNAFANTDLEMLLRQRGVDRVIVIGPLANTCAESTARGAMELGFHVTLVTDATVAFSEEAMDAAHRINAPTYAHAVVSTQELLGAW